MSLNDSSSNPTVISRETTKRLIKDVRELIKSPLHDEGIYYKHDENNVLKGYAYICGPKDSVYYGGNYFYEFNFPYDYPHRPPQVIFLNMGGKYGNTRFHPNMYKNGKMCLSILNTWRGDQWTGCQSIRTILLTILSILDNAPLLHEPGFSETHRDFIPYNEIIRYNNLEYSVCYILQDKEINLKYIKEKFEENIKHEFNKNKNSLMENINELEKNANNIIFSTSIYNLRLNTDWTYIKNEFKKINI